MPARRPLLTALGATTLLAALWFVPSANATAPQDAQGASAAPGAANTGPDAARTGTVIDAGDGNGAAAGGDPVATLTLADTGSVDTTPYVLGGTLCLGLGAGFVTFSVRRSRAL
ncbi:hypothetical protein OOK31_12870 [Streptomyces sp. NBC_00249]|uniref:hypothetical protein n=1 Tax=Streptomyces sp. NBC_00249 TaxID=2975690 RepID=UPI00224CCF79|nr:hypothetical protein [Streptomyces sp. NBC_00249]MCX5194780.1 hypothetical protein [Streptomyces sp. NBC_00249]